MEVQNQRIDDPKESLNARIAAWKANFYARIISLEEKFNVRFDTIIFRLDAIERRLGELEQRVKRLEDILFKPTLR